MRYLDVAQPSLIQRVEAATRGVRNARFVQLDVVKVINPGEVALSFDVFFEPDGGARVWLGTFGPFPADHPGEFIVPTKGLVHPGGTLIVSMVIPQGVAGADSTGIRVGIGRITLVP